MTTPRRDRKRKGSPEWVRLGEQLADRRADLSPDYEGHGGRAAFARDRDVNLKLIQDIELNARENFTPPTLRDVIAPAYGVTYESIRRALSGGELEPLPPPAPPAAAPPRRERRLKALEDSDEPGLQPFLQGVLRQVYTAAGIISAFPAGRDLPGLDQLPELEPVLEQMPGETVFPGSATDPLLWDNPLLGAAERVRLVARVRSMAAKHGGAGQRDRQVSGLAPWRGRGAAGAVPLARYRAGIT